MKYYEIRYFVEAAILFEVAHLVGGIYPKEILGLTFWEYIHPDNEFEYVHKEDEDNMFPDEVFKSGQLIKSIDYFFSKAPDYSSQHIKDSEKLINIAETEEIMKALRNEAYKSLPGYEDGVWGVPEPNYRDLADGISGNMKLDDEEKNVKEEKTQTEKSDIHRTNDIDSDMPIIDALHLDGLDNLYDIFCKIIYEHYITQQTKDLRINVIQTMSDDHILGINWDCSNSRHKLRLEYKPDSDDPDRGLTVTYEVFQLSGNPIEHEFVTIYNPDDSSRNYQQDWIIEMVTLLNKKDIHQSVTHGCSLKLSNDDVYNGPLIITWNARDPSERLDTRSLTIYDFRRFLFEHVSEGYCVDEFVMERRRRVEFDAT